MVEGELLQLTHLHKIDVTEDDYLELADRKTAMLFSTCLRLGAILADELEILRLEKKIEGEVRSQVQMLRVVIPKA
jgi:geranylgeranyl pyrophosphate synthase